MFYLTTHSTHFIYGYMASDIWLWTILIVRKETHCRHIGYSFRLAARVLLYAPSHRQDSTYHSLCYTSRGALAGTRNSSMGPPHEGSIRRPIAPWANALTTELHLAPLVHRVETDEPWNNDYLQCCSVQAVNTPKTDIVTISLRSFPFTLLGTTKKTLLETMLATHWNINNFSKVSKTANTGNHASNTLKY